jgi:predicted nicotinamide N-methyase
MVSINTGRSACQAMAAKTRIWGGSTGKVCLELGCGAGLVGLCTVKLGAAQVVLTDGDASTIENCLYNLRLNSIAADSSALDSDQVRLPNNSRDGQFSDNADGSASTYANSEGLQAMSICDVTVVQRDWGDLHSWPIADLILGADLLYDPGM